MSSILVVGTGSGRLGTQIRELIPQMNLIEVDKNKFVIDRLLSKYKNDFLRKQYCADIGCMPLNDDSIDMVICYSVFRYIDDINTAIDELMRVLKKDGVIIIAEAKNFNTVEKIKKELDIKKICFRMKTIPSVRLPHLTFYYYLLNKYFKDKTITDLINKKRKDNISYFQSAFELAGSSLGSIYALILKKSV